MHRNVPSLTFRKFLRPLGQVILVLALMYFGISGFLETYFPEGEDTSEAEWIENNVESVQQMKSPLCFAVIGSHPVNSSLFLNILSEINRDPDIQFTVDLGNRVDQDEEREYSDFLNLYQDNCGKPLLPVIGRHRRRMLDRYFYTLFFGPRYYTFQVGNVCFVMLDTSQPAHITDRQIRWLEGTLGNARQRCCHTLVFMSVPLRTPCHTRNHPPVPSEKANRLIRLFEVFSPSHVFSGQTCGVRTVTLPGGIPYTSTGFSNWGEELDANHNCPHFLKVALTASGQVRVEVRDLEGGNSR